MGGGAGINQSETRPMGGITGCSGGGIKTVEDSKSRLSLEYKGQISNYRGIKSVNKTVEEGQSQQSRGIGRGGDFRWLEVTDERCHGPLILTEKNLARQYWQRWRKEERTKVVSKKRSRRGLLMDNGTTSMGPPGPVRDVTTEVGGDTLCGEELQPGGPRETDVVEEGCVGVPAMGADQQGVHCAADRGSGRVAGVASDPEVQKGPRVNGDEKEPKNMVKLVFKEKRGSSGETEITSGQPQNDAFR